jgi:hypothetical protein
VIRSAPLLLVLAGCVSASSLNEVRIADGRLSIVPWGFNYDHDETGRLIEDYWDTEWSKVEEDFREMKELGANVVRIHLQLAKFMKSPDAANERSLERLGRLLELAGRVGIYLDLTGLGCYHKKDVPPWYDGLSEEARWDVQARFWEAVAKACAASPAVFCYDLMNEPVVPAGKNAPGQWLGPPFGGKHFVQWISLDVAGRKREEIARAWCRKLVGAIRRVDPRHLITVGLVDWSLKRPGMLYSGFAPEAIAPEIDFLCIHLYPKAKKVDAAIETLDAFRAAGKPVVIEETFLLECGVEDFEAFLDRTRGGAAGWIGFYWGRTLEECRKSREFADALMAQWLEIFRRRARE